MRKCTFGVFAVFPVKMLVLGCEKKGWYQSFHKIILHLHDQQLPIFGLNQYLPALDLQHA